MISSELCPFTLTSVWHVCCCQGTATARTSPSNTKQEQEVQPSLLGCPDQAVEKSPTFLGPPPASLCRLRGVCTTIPCSFPEWWTKPYLSPLCRGLAFTGWKGRVWMSCTFLWLCCLLRWGMDSLLEPMDSTPLDDWLQTLEPSKNLDGEQKGAQVVSSAKSHWSRVRDGIWPKRVTVMMGFKVVAQEQKKGNGTERKNCRTWVKNLEPKVA